MSDETTTQTRPRLPEMTRAQPSVRWRLHVLCCPDDALRGAVLTLQPGATVFGRRPQGAPAVTVDDGAMSRSHVSFVTVPASPSLQVLDNRSRNGTWVGGKRSGQSAAEDGAVVRFGDTVVVVEADRGDCEAHSAPTAAVAGTSAGARRIRAALERAGRLPGCALIWGETGTGKESAAGAVHLAAKRTGALVRLNVAALPASLFEGELWGHVRGAFSGATEARAGRVREAERGTLVLDEIGELAPELQPKLLRLLEEGHLRPLGAAKDVPFDVKFVATTNVDIDAAVAAGRLRADLVARLRAHEVHLPPLRARRADLLGWADAVHPAPDRRGWSAALSADAVEFLLLYDHPENLRGLARVLRAACDSDQARPFGLGALPPAWVQAVRAGAHTDPAPNRAVAGTAEPGRYGQRAPSAGELRALLATHRGNIGAMARALGRDRKQIYRWLEAVGIDDEELRAWRGGR